MPRFGGSTTKGRSGAIVVAASDSYYIRSADRVCSGADDDVIVLAAMQENENVQLLDGTYYFTSAPTYQVANQKVFGQGWNTIIEHSLVGGAFTLIDYCSLSDMAIKPQTATSNGLVLQGAVGNTLYYPQLENLWIEGANGVEAASGITFDDWILYLSAHKVYLHWLQNGIICSGSGADRRIFASTFVDILGYECAIGVDIQSGGGLSFINSIFEHHTDGVGFQINDARIKLLGGHIEQTGTADVGVRLLAGADKIFITTNLLAAVPIDASAIDSGHDYIYYGTDLGPVGNQVLRNVMYNTSVIEEVENITESRIRGDLVSVLDVAQPVHALWPFVETTATVVVLDYGRRGHDLSASENVSSWDTIPTFKSRGTYYTFNGTDEDLIIADHADFRFDDGAAEAVSWVFLALVDDTAAIRTPISKWSESFGGESREWKIEIAADDTLVLRLYDETNDEECSRASDTAVTIDVWKVFIVTYDGSGGATAADGITLYENGAVVASTATNNASYVSMVGGGGSVRVGSYLDSAGNRAGFYDGQMTWPMVVGKELSADEVWIITQKLRSMLGF